MSKPAPPPVVHYPSTRHTSSTTSTTTSTTNDNNLLLTTTATSNGSNWLNSGFLNDKFSAHCQRAQGKPFLRTGVPPAIGQRIELSIILTSGYRAQMPFRLSGEVVNGGKDGDANSANGDNGNLSSASTMRDGSKEEGLIGISFSEEDTVAADTVDYNDDDDDGGVTTAGVASVSSSKSNSKEDTTTTITNATTNTNWRPSTCPTDIGINGGSLALAHMVRALILQQQPSLTKLTAAHVSSVWEDKLSHEEKEKISNVVIEKLGARHGRQVLCEGRLNFDYDIRRGSEDGPWIDGIPFDGRDIWQFAIVADDSMEHIWRVDPSSFVNLGRMHRPRCWPWSLSNVLPYQRMGTDAPLRGPGPNGKDYSSFFHI